MENVNPLAIEAVEHPAGRLHDLSIAGASPKFRRSAATGRVLRKLADMRVYTLHQRDGGVRIFKRDVIRDGFQIGQRGIGPDYFSHRASRAFASA